LKRASLKNPPLAQSICLQTKRSSPLANTCGYLRTAQIAPKKATFQRGPELDLILEPQYQSEADCSAPDWDACACFSPEQRTRTTPTLLSRSCAFMARVDSIVRTKPLSRRILNCRRRHVDHPAFAVGVLLGTSTDLLQPRALRRVKVRRIRTTLHVSGRGPEWC
jgi:hypothetical protein